MEGSLTCLVWIYGAREPEVTSAGKSRGSGIAVWRTSEEKTKAWVCQAGTAEDSLTATQLNGTK